MIYVSQSGDGVRFLKKSKAYSGRFYQGDIFQAPGAQGTWSGRAKKGSTALGSKVTEAEKRQPECAAG